MKAIPQALLTVTLATSSIELAAPQPAVADFRAAQKRTYFRQTPKLIEGGTFLTKDLKMRWSLRITRSLGICSMSTLLR